MSVRIRMPSVSFVVARSEPDHIIGCDNQLPWRLRSDLRNFKAITSNHVVIMGRKTFDSIGRPLPNRINVVLSSRSIAEQGDVVFAKNRISALYMADLFSVLHGYKEVFVIGGGTIYKEFEYNKIYLTEVYAEGIRGDTHFDKKFDMRSWTLLSEQKFPASEFDEYPFAIKVLKKKDETTHLHRTRSLAKFLTPDKNLTEWELSQLSRLKLPRVKSSKNMFAGIQLEFLTNLAGEIDLASVKELR
ncbi:MAG: dihydrofolate reductase [Rhizomicrobium sp.]